MISTKDLLVSMVFLAVDNLPSVKKSKPTEINKVIAETIKRFVETRLTLTGLFIGTIPAPSGVVPDTLSGPKVYLVDEMPLSTDELNDCSSLNSPVGAAGQKWIYIINEAVKKTKFKKIDAMSSMSSLQNSPDLSLSIMQNPIPVPDTHIANLGMPIPSLPNAIYKKVALFATTLENASTKEEIKLKLQEVIPNKENEWYNNDRIIMYGTYDILFSPIVEAITNTFMFPTPATNASSTIPGSMGVLTWVKTVWLSV